MQDASHVLEISTTDTGSLLFCQNNLRIHHHTFASMNGDLFQLAIRMIDPITQVGTSNAQMPNLNASFALTLVESRHHKNGQDGVSVRMARTCINNICRARACKFIHR